VFSKKWRYDKTGLILNRQNGQWSIIREHGAKLIENMSREEYSPLTRFLEWVLQYVKSRMYEKRGHKTFGGPSKWESTCRASGDTTKMAEENSHLQFHHQFPLR